MAEMYPLVSVRNFKPNSLPLVSPLEMIAGTALEFQIEQGHGRVATLILIPAPGVSRFAVSSTARLLIVTLPAILGVHVCVHVLLPGVHPDAGCHVAPPSTETSTPATRPPPESVALPVIVADCGTVKVAPGRLIVDTGDAVSMDCEAGTRPG